MFGRYVFEKTPAVYTNKVLIIDMEFLLEKSDIVDVFRAHSFRMIWYKDDLSIRLEHMTEIMNPAEKIVLVARTDQYIPYDIQKKFTKYELKMQDLFPMLNAEAVAELSDEERELLVQVYEKNYSKYPCKQETIYYIDREVRIQSNAKRYAKYLTGILDKKVEKVNSYRDWYEIARKKAAIDVLAAKYNFDVQIREINDKFATFILEEFGMLSGKLDKDSPILVSHAMEYMRDNSEKFVIIVMDGMSEFDWNILKKSFDGMKYYQNEMFAMIPTTTSISRQCLITNKFPSQLGSPWNLAKEKQEFISCAKNLGYQENQIEYKRGYDSDFDMFVRCGAIIINEIDDLVHGQTQGRIGMYHDIDVLNRQHKLRNLVEKLLKRNFDVYISSDHGNTPCVGQGRLMGTGVEVETKCRRMIVLKDFADKVALSEKRNLQKYPKYYLPKEYDYLLCKEAESFDTKGAEVMSHGGMTLDEVVVPFIKFKAVENNG